MRILRASRAFPSVASDAVLRYAMALKCIKTTHKDLKMRQKVQNDARKYETDPKNTKRCCGIKMRSCVKKLLGCIGFDPN